MKKYEMIKELFNNCSGGASATFDEVETEDVEAYLKKMRYITEKSVVTKIESDSALVYEVENNGITAKYTFTEL